MLNGDFLFRDAAWRRGAADLQSLLHAAEELHPTRYPLPGNIVPKRFMDPVRC